MAKHHGYSAILKLADLIDGRRRLAGGHDRHAADFLVEQLQDDIGLLSHVVVRVANDRLMMHVAGGGLEAVQQRRIKSPPRFRHHQGEDVLSVLQFPPGVVFHERSFSLHAADQAFVFQRGHRLTNGSPRDPQRLDQVMLGRDFFPRPQPARDHLLGKIIAQLFVLRLRRVFGVEFAEAKTFFKHEKTVQFLLENVTAAVVSYQPLQYQFHRAL